MAGTLTLGTVSGETLADLSTYVGTVVSQLYTEGYNFIQDLRDAAEADFNSIIEPDTLNYLNLTFDPSFYVAPASPDLSLSEISNKIDQLAALETPTAPTLSTPSVTIPTLDSGVPVLSMPDRPDSDIGEIPTDAPSIQDVEPPTAPTVTLPNVPTFEELQLPVAPSYSLPTFQATAPTGNLTTPTNTFDYVDEGYTSELRDPLVEKLLDNLQDGGYGIETTDEQALWARARDRAEQEAKIAVDQAGKDAVSTSFPMPQGAYFAKLDKARQTINEKLSEINREIALKRADMYVENRKFTIQEVQKYEQMAMALYNAVEERALNFAKATADIGIAIHDAAVRKFNAEMDAYKTEVQVFESRVRAELSKAELFKAQIEAESLRGQFNQIKVNMYNAQLQGIQQVVNLYKSRIEAANLLSELQQQKLDIFKSRVQVFAEKVRAKQSEFDMYRAGIMGEMAKVDVFKTEVDAYKSRVDAEETKARITLQSNQALLQRYEAAITQYRSQLEGFSKTVDSRLDMAKTQLLGYNSDVVAFRTIVDAVQEANKIRLSNQQVNNAWNIAALNSRVEAAKFRLEQLRLTTENRVKIGSYGAEYFRTMLGSVLSSLNGLSVKTE